VRTTKAVAKELPVLVGRAMAKEHPVLADRATAKELPVLVGRAMAKELPALAGKATAKEHPVLADRATAKERRGMGTERDWHSRPPWKDSGGRRRCCLGVQSVWLGLRGDCESL
jgi:hypothetical protein